jgi:hypothetical protein
MRFNLEGLRKFVPDVRRLRELAPKKDETFGQWLRTVDGAHPFIFSTVLLAVGYGGDPLEAKYTLHWLQEHWERWHGTVEA